MRTGNGRKEFNILPESLSSSTAFINPKTNVKTDKKYNIFYRPTLLSYTFSANCKREASQKCFYSILFIIVIMFFVVFFHVTDWSLKIKTFLYLASFTIWGNLI